MDTTTARTVTTAPAATDRRPTRKMKIGLGIVVLLSLGDLPSAFNPTPDGQEGPPLGVLVLGTVLAVIAITAAVIAWRSGRRAALRVTAACAILSTVSALPAFFVDVPAFIKLAVAITTLLTLAAVVLMFSGNGRRRPQAGPAPRADW